jgi:dihydroorotate dehydrogenase
MYKFCIRPFLFLVSPERAHHIALSMLHFALCVPLMKNIFKRIYCIDDDRLKRTVFGIEFPNPIGLAAGFDKQATHYKDLRYLGFGFIEIGTITPIGQPGNPQPRLFRLPADKGLINRMGFNNEGIGEAIKQLKNRPEGVIIGGNIGKNKHTPNEKAVEDYEQCLLALDPFVDYFTVNVSSPNTPGLRALQDKEPLRKLLLRLVSLKREIQSNRPILLKIAPDLSQEQLNDIIDLVKEAEIDGVIATNTTLIREGLTSDNANEAGGLSGEPLQKRATEVIRYLHQKSNGAFPIIGVGGIHDPASAIEKLKAGASLIQVYTGFIYEGPSFVKAINKAVLRRGL